MADPLGTLMQVVEIVGKVNEIYQRIQDAPDKIQHIGRRMTTLDTTLRSVESLLRRDKKNTLIRHAPALIDRLLVVIKDIRKESEGVHALFVKWDKDIGPWGMQFRFKFAAQAYFALGSSSDRLEALNKNIEEYRADLRELLAVMNSHLIIDAQNPVFVKQPPPSSSPQAPCTDFGIIFVDPYGTARSIVAEAYTSLLREWTLRTGGQWRIKIAHSAGFFVRTRSEVVDTINSMQVRKPSYKLDFKDGHSPPAPIPLAALFENKLFNYPYKQDVKRAIESRRSRGLTKMIFKTYDYILVFTAREEDNLLRLRELLVDGTGKDVTTARRKGTVVHLGRYLTRDGARKEIVVPENDGDRDQWNAKVGQIKLAIKAFLQGELGWKQPPRGAAHLQG